MEPANVNDKMILDSNLSSNNRNAPASFPVSFSVDNSMRQNKPKKMEDNSQGSAKKLQSNMKSSMNRKHVLNAPAKAKGVSSSSSSAYGLAHNQNSSHMIMQVDLHQQLQHQAPATLIEKPTSSPRLNAFKSSNQMQQQQNLSTTSAMLQQQSSTGFHSPARLILRNPESFNVIQQADQSNVQTKQPVNMHNGLVSEHARPKLMVSAFPQSQSRNFQLANQNKSEKQPQPGPSQVQMPIPADWAEQAFYLITQYKADCLSEVQANFTRATEQISQVKSKEEVARLENLRSAYRYMRSFLLMSKSEIEKGGKENFHRFMNLFGRPLGKIRAQNSLRTQQAQQTDASSSQLVTSQLSHRGPAPPQFFGTLPNLPGPLIQQRPSSLNASPVMSYFQVGSPAEVKMLDDSNKHAPSNQMSQRISIPSPHEGENSGFEQGSSVKKRSSSYSIPRQLTFTSQQQKVTSPRKTINSLESSISEKNNNLNISPQQSPCLESILHITQKRSSGSPLRLGINKCSSSFSIPSPQHSQHSASMAEFSKPRTPSLATSPKTFPTPLNPPTPVSKATDPEISSLSLEESNNVPKVSVASVEPPKQNDPVMEGLVSAPLVTEPSIPDKKDFSNDAELPITRLINAVKNMSPTALQSSVCDIKAILEMNDWMTGRHRQEERTMDIVKDLSGDVRAHNVWNFSSMYKTGSELRMKRQLDSIGSMVKMEGQANDMVKRPKKEPNDELLREIEEINYKLMEVTVDANAGHSEETSIVKCSYSPAGHFGKGKRNTSPATFPLVLELTVTADYPHSSPIIVGTQPPSCSQSEKRKQLWLKAMSNLRTTIRNFVQPISPSRNS